MRPLPARAAALGAVRVSPFEVAVSGQDAALLPRRKAELLALSRTAERRAGCGQPADIVLVTVQHRRYWAGRTREVYEQIAARGSRVIAFGVGLPTDLSAAAHGRPCTVGVGEDDLLADEWSVIFCSPHRRWGFVARVEAAGLPGARSGPRVPPAGLDDVPDMDRRFLWADLRDPVGLERAAAVLLTRVPALAVTVPWLSRTS